MRIDVYNVTFGGVGGGSQYNATTIDALYLGRGSVLFGLMYDLSGVF